MGVCVRGGEEWTQILSTPAEANEELFYLLSTEHKTGARAAPWALFTVSGGEQGLESGGALLTCTHPHLTPCWRQRRIKNTSCSERDKSIFIRAAPLTPPWQINIFLHNGFTKAATKSPGNAKQPHKEYRQVIEYLNLNFNYPPSRARWYLQEGSWSKIHGAWLHCPQSTVLWAARVSTAPSWQRWVSPSLLEESRIPRMRPSPREMGSSEQTILPVKIPPAGPGTGKKIHTFLGWVLGWLSGRTT